MKLADLRKRFRPEPAAAEVDKFGNVVYRDQFGRPYTPVPPEQTHQQAMAPKVFKDLNITFNCKCGAPVGNDFHCQACEDRKEARDPK